MYSNSEDSPKQSLETCEAVAKSSLQEDCFEFCEVIASSSSTQSEVFNIKSTLTFLETKYDVVSEYWPDNEGNPKCMFFQDLCMKDTFNFFPDRMCIDLTYKCTNIDIFMFLFICENSNGQSFVISLGFSRTVEPDSLTWLYNTFKKHNPNWRRIKLIIVDSEIKHRNVLKVCFPNQFILICFYHAHKSFKKVLDNYMSGLLSDEQKIYCLELFKNMYLAHTHSGYELCYQQFQALQSEIVSYFQEFWIPMQYQWRTGLDYCHEDIFCCLNSYLNELDHSIKPVFLSDFDFSDFMKKIFIILSVKRREYSSTLTQDALFLYSRFSPEYQICKAVTPFAAKFVIEQLNLSAEIHMEYGTLADSYFFDYLGTSATASATVCSCQFYTFTLLPCRHIFAVRKVLSLCIFDDTMTDYSWTLQFLQNTLMCMENSQSNNATVSTFSNPISKQSFASNVLEEILPLLLECPNSDFDSRYDALRQIGNSWKNDEDVILKFSGIDLNAKTVTQNAASNNAPSKLQNDLEKTNLNVNSNKLCLKEKKRNKNFVQEVESKGKWNFKSQILNGKFINYTYLCRIICDTKDSCFEWLQNKELISKTMQCPLCGAQMKLKKMPRLSDGSIWFCSNITVRKRSCSKRCSIRKGSWFELTNITLEQILTFCYMWINKFNQNQIILETGISSAAYVWLNKFFTRVCAEITDENCQTEPYDSVQVLDKWLGESDEEDKFLKLLKNASAIHENDCSKRKS